MVDIVAEDGRYAYGQQREHGEHRFGALAHVAHVAESHERYDGHNLHQRAHGLAFREVAGEGRSSYYEHDDILDDCDGVAGPERVGRKLGEREVALEHVNGVLLEGEYGRIVEHAEQGHEPESAAAQDVADVAYLKRVVLLFGLAGLLVKLLVHEEVDDEHDERYHQEHHAEGYRARHVDVAAELGEHGREYHTRGDA